MTAPNVAEKLRAEIADYEARILEARKDLAELQGEVQPLGLTLPEVIARQVGLGTRYPTGLPTLDEKTGGGIPRGRLVGIVGKPGVGKTSLASQIAVNMAVRRDAAILALFADSGLDDAALTVAQQLGIAREAAMAGAPDAIDAARRETFGLQMHLVDPDKPYSIEDLAARFVGCLPPGVAPILLLDSAQVLRCPDAKARTVYDRITAISNLVKSITSRHRLITLLVSQSNRASYANSAVAKENDPLASGAGGGALEFMPDLHLFLDKQKDGPIKLTCSKSRLGPYPWSVTLGLDFARHRHMEIDEESVEAEVDAAHLAAVRDAEEQIRAVCRREPSGVSTRHLEELCKGRKVIHREARHAMWETAELISEERKGKGGGLVWKLGRNPGKAEAS